jgi:hypothetical protein
MSNWTYTKPPNWNANVGSGKQSNYIATAGGWQDSTTGEIVVAIPNLLHRQGTAALEYVALTTPTKTTYKLNDPLSFKVAYSQNMVVTGNPVINFTVNGVAKTAAYASGSTGNVLTFTHTVSSSDAKGTPVVVTSPIVLTGGTIKDVVDAANAPLAFTPPTSTGITVDGVVPTVSSVTTTNGTHYLTAGPNPINLTATFSEAVIVTGVPSIGVTINGTVRAATYTSGSGTTALVFAYTVVAGDVAIAGQVTTAAVIVLNGGTIKDTPCGNAVSPLTFSAPTTTTVAVN